MKRLFDVIVSVILLLMLSPVFIVVPIVILMDDGAPVLLRQKRMGAHGKPFTIFKFRTMRVSAPHDVATGELEDPYRHITRLGRFLRKASLDEWPQLINVLLGQMSLVGPRPVVLSEGKLIRLRTEAGVYAVRPGMTGWAQINGRDCVSIREKVEMDRYYAEHRSFGLDMKILFKTPVVVLFHHGIHEGYVSPGESADG